MRVKITVGELRLFTFASYGFEPIPCRIVGKKKIYHDYQERIVGCLYSYENLTTGEVSKDYYSELCFSAEPMTEMEILAWSAQLPTI